MPFFTEIDSRAAIKGSRDPLGYQPVWAAFGRQVVGNLTTVTTSVRNFTTLMLGLYFADRAIAAGKCSEADRVNAFLKFEQLAAYSRHAYSGADQTSERPRGSQRVQYNLAEGDGTVRISAKQEHQILSSQKTYGLWGLFMVASRQSGLVEQGENRLTNLAKEFIEENYLPRLEFEGNRNGSQIIRYLERYLEFTPKGKQQALGRKLSEVLHGTFTEQERKFYNQALVYGQAPECDHTDGRQERLWQTIVRVNNDKRAGWTQPFGYGELITVRDDAEARGDQSLANALDSISIVEPVLASSAMLFSFLLLHDNADIDMVVSDVRKQWGRAGLRHLQADKLAALQITAVSKINQLTQQLHAGDYAGAIHTLLALNAEVMKSRGGAPWVTMNKGRLKVQLREESGWLPERADLPGLWQNTYFINSLKWVGKTLNCP